MEIKKTKGYFGITRIYKLHNFIFGFKSVTPEGEEYFLRFPNKWRKIHSKKYSRNLGYQDTSCAFNAANLREIEAAKERAGTDGTIVLYVLESLSKTGGTERRLEIQFSWLRAHGIEPIIICEQQLYEPLRSYSTIFAQFSSPNISDILTNFIRLTNATTLEFNIKCSRLMHSVDIEMLKTWARIGCMFHNEADVDLETLKQLDYTCSSANRKCLEGHGILIPNTVLPSEPQNKYNPLSKKALYIGRIDSDKLKSLLSFIKVCKLNGFSFDIGGVFSDEKSRSFAKTLPEKSRLGLIDTRKYLLENGRNYAFVGGVGQVALESAVANLPTLIAAHSGPEDSYFLTRENLDASLSQNCVMRKPGSIKSNITDFFEDLKNSKEHGTVDALSNYLISDEILEKRGVDNIMRKYSRILLGNIHNSQFHNANH